ncbi:carboxypeptidase-like regulatory domain-containing protein [Prevotella sp.]|uniref:carboxypeptidase-like regulatory domain-containing protein n=1 Tax=Prevotella sp. TaxID=59823 RepID=UPI001CAEB24D|nr:carboxypeptidase-like regulatory domain-containing protein [Prevotella sp.]MBF1618838.1 carboxypeptidase-like regulatory domain-containing protein [Prevotella sp.]
MEEGKAICKVLKEVRQRIAKENGISYKPVECHHEGECSGTCPGCEKEIRYLEEQLRNKQRGGLGLKVAGIAAGVCVTVLPMAAMVQTESKISLEANPQLIKQDSIKVVDLTNGNPDAVLLRGQVLDKETKDSLLGAVVMLKDSIDPNGLGTCTNVDGWYAVKALPTDTLEAGFVGYHKTFVTVKELLATKDKTIYLEEDTTYKHVSFTLGGIKGTTGKYHPKKGPKSHKEKNKKKCK